MGERIYRDAVVAKAGLVAGCYTDNSKMVCRDEGNSINGEDHGNEIKPVPEVQATNGTSCLYTE